MCAGRPVKIDPILTGKKKGQEMIADKLSKRGYPIYSANPFVHRIVINQRKKSIVVSRGDLDIVDKDGDYIAPATVGSFIQVEQDEFIKVYTKEMRAFFDLSRVGTRMIGIVFRACQILSINKSEIFLSYKEAIEIYNTISENEKFSESSYTRGIKELLNKEFIAEHPRGLGWFYTNPNIFFNGNRLRFVREYCKTEGYLKIKNQFNVVEQ